MGTWPCRLFHVWAVFRLAGGTHPRNVTRAGLGQAFKAAYRDVVKHHTLQVSAALSYYLILSVFPALIFVSAVLATLLLPDLFGQVLGLAARLLPAETTALVQSVLRDLATNRKPWLSLGMVGTIWVASAAFDAIIEALDIAYDVKEGRPFWKTRLLAIGLAAITGSLLLSALAVMIVGPRLGLWLAERIHLSHQFVSLWPVIHWAVAISFTLLTVELLYFLAPNVKQRFLATLPGAILAVTCWIGFSDLLGFYFRHVANYSRMYGTLGGFIAFMTWFYWNSLALLVGAELNAELAKKSAQGQLLTKEQPPTEDTVDRGA